MNRKEQADKLLEVISEYLTNAGWLMNTHTLFRIDPITNTSHHTMTALDIQLDRDFQKKV